MEADSHKGLLQNTDVFIEQQSIWRLEMVSIKFNKQINGEMSCNENIFSLERYSWMDGRSTHLTQMNQGDSDLESLKETDVRAQETIRWRGHRR